MNLRQAAQQALEALTLSIPKPRPADDDYAELGWEEHNAAITALRAALAEPKQEPVAWAVYDILHGGSKTLHWPEQHSPNGDPKQYKAVPLYTAPIPRRPLTEDQIVDIWAGVSMGYDDEINIIELARAIERAHGIGDSNE